MNKGMTARGRHKTVLVSAGIVGAMAWGMTAGGAVAQAAPVPQATAAVSYTNMHEVSDAELNQLIRAMDNLPVHLKNADPRTTPGYEQQLEAALDAQGLGSQAQSFSAWRCGLAIAGLIVQYGVPVGKVLSWIKKARSLYGNIKGIINAIRNGQAAAAIGVDAVKVLEGILGTDSVRIHCFG